MANRLHCLDRLRLTATPSVLLSQANRPFARMVCRIKKTELSLPLGVFLFLCAPWGMRRFLLAAGAEKESALRHRTRRRHANEHLTRRLFPSLGRCLPLTPIVRYLEWTKRIQTRLLSSSVQEFVGNRALPISFASSELDEYHRSAFGFLFSFSPKKTL